MCCDRDGQVRRPSGPIPGQALARLYSFRVESGSRVIYIIRSRATAEQVAQMQETLDTYIKLAVDIRRGILAGGGAMHADCEAVLLEDGSQQDDIWGADWDPAAQLITFEALINIRPRQDNPSMDILAARTREAVERIVWELLGGA